MLGEALRAFAAIFILLMMLLALDRLVYGLLNSFRNTPPPHDFRIYKGALLIGFLVLFATYFEGNFLASNLPALGSTPSIIHWNDPDYNLPKILSCVVYAVLILIFTILIRRSNLTRTIRYSTFAALAVLIMQISGLVATFATNNPFETEPINYVATTKNLDTVSKNKNFFIFLIDTVSAVEFDNYLSAHKSESSVFNDFVFYKDTLAGYPATIYSIPFILSGAWNENETDFSDYSTRAYDESPLLKSLAENDYEIDLYKDELIWQSEKRSVVENLESCEAELDRTWTTFSWQKWILYKYFPFPLKSLSGIEDFYLNPSCFIENSADETAAGVETTQTETAAKIENEIATAESAAKIEKPGVETASEVEKAQPETFSANNKFLYDHFRSNDLTLTDKNVFHFIYTEGAHLPFTSDENLNEIENGTYEQKLAASLKLFETWQQRLKDSGAYDNSVIILMSDHGYDESNYKDPNNYNHYGRQNPALLIKGLNEHHKTMLRSDLPISFTDLNDAYSDLLNEKPATELFANVSRERRRRYLYYDFTDETHLSEYEQTGKAWDSETLVPTGRKFNL